jgi:hypothetical protein
MRSQDPLVATRLTEDPAQPFKPGLSADPGVSVQTRD